MAKISLRAYNHEIETLIERGHTEEAIAHCKYILKSYPKHLDSYRLLGKAFLESQRYSEAGDILQRILSVQPDDFVAQIGMSIIREDEGNLDAAIYHMERAFEIQPSNAAIQDELRRLYGRRDGMEPPKLRLTRGALVRMYARGDLYRQAIAEARAAIVEDPQRLDLEIVLARMYYQTGQKAEAAEICSRLVSKLPFCLEANRVLADVLPETSRSEDANIYQQRLVALEPYLAYLSETALDIQQVPENAITLDWLEWTPSIETDQQPTWAKSLGIQIDEKASEKMPDWLADIPAAPKETTAETEKAQPFSEEPSLFENQNETISTEPSVEPTQPAALPDWMESVGWSVSGRPEQEQPELTPTITSDEQETSTAAPAEIPDWLKDMAPAGSEPSQPASTEDQQNLDWLASLLPSETPVVAEKTSEMMPPLVEEAAQLPIAPEVEAIPAFSDDLPDWLKGTSLPTEETVSTDQSQEPLPDWLIESAEMQPAPPMEMKVPQEAEAIQPQEPVISETAAELQMVEPEPAGDIPAAEILNVPPVEMVPSVPDLENMDDAMAWLESLAARQGADEETLLTRPEDRTETAPVWISQTVKPVETAQLPDLQEEPTGEFVESLEASIAPVEAPAAEVGHLEMTQEPVALTTQETPVVTLTEPPVPLQEAPTQPMTELELPQEQIPLQTASGIELPVAPAMVAAEAELTVEGMESEETVQPQVITSQPTGDVELIPPQELPVELSVPEEQIQTPETTVEVPGSPMENQGEIDMDAAFAWLESLASKQGAEADTLLVAPEERQETPPDWIQQQAIEVEAAEELSAPSAVLVPDAQFPDWMKTTEETPVNEALPDWLKVNESTPDAASKTTQSEFESILPQGLPETQVTEPTSSAVTPDWIQGFEEIGEEKAVSLTPEGEKPAEIGPSTGAAVVPPIPAEFGHTRPLPSWLAGIVEQPVVEPTEPEEVIPADQPLPDWLQVESPSAIKTQEVGTFPLAKETTSLPDWLKNLEAEQEEPMPEEPVMAIQSEAAPDAMEISSDPNAMIGQAQSALGKGQIDLALTVYGNLIQQDQHVEDTIHDLRDALYRFPVDSSIWQTLGDAYMSSNRLQDALDAYTKAEELLK